MIKTVKRADGTRHQVYGKRKGKKVYLGTYDSKREALAVDEEHRVKQRRIAAGELPEEHDDRLTFRKAIDLWVAMLRATGSRSLVPHESRARVHLVPEFKDTPIVEIDKARIVKWRDHASTQMSAANVNTLLGSLSSAFSWFVEQRWLERSPSRGVKQLVRPKKTFPWLQSSEQVTRLLAACPYRIVTIIAVLVGTGMRFDEALHLHWDDIDLEHRLITVQRGRKGMPKSGKGRHVPIMDDLLPVLREMRLARGEQRMLWPSKRRNRKPGEARTQPSIRKAFHAAVKKAELDTRMRIHDLRHSFASLFLLNGGDIFKLSKILGHSSVAITERVYAHLCPDAFSADYGRVRFRMPSTEASPIRLHQPGDRRGQSDIANSSDSAHVS